MNAKLDLKDGHNLLAFIGGIYPKRIHIITSVMDEGRKHYIYKYWVSSKRKWFRETVSESLLAFQVRLGKERIQEYQSIGLKPPPYHLR